MKNSSDILQLLERLSRILQNDTHSGNLKPTQWEALRFLARANRFSRNPKALTTYLGVGKGSVSQTLIALERKKLVTKETSATDRRNILLNLTDAAYLLLSEEPSYMLERIITGLGEMEIAALEGSLANVLQATLKERGGKMFGVCKTCRFFEEASINGNPHSCNLLNVSLSSEDSNLICVENETR